MKLNIQDNSGDKEFFTIIDFVDAYHHFLDPEWDGEPIDQTSEDREKEMLKQSTLSTESISLPVQGEKPEKLKIKLRDGKEREIQHMVSTIFMDANGHPMSSQEFLNKMFGTLPEFFKDEEDLRKIWSNPSTRKAFLEKIADLGFGNEQLELLQKIIDAENSDLFDVLIYIMSALKPISRAERIQKNKDEIFQGLDQKHREFIEFVLAKYQEKGVEELGEEKLPQLLNLKYNAIADAEKLLGDVDCIRSTFFDFQRKLYV